MNNPWENPFERWRRYEGEERPTKGERDEQDDNLCPSYGLEDRDDDPEER